jgi:periplasmic protein TonB
MRIILPESGRARKRAVGGTLVSAIVHVAIIGGTIVATGWTAETRRSAREPGVVDLVYIRETPPRRPPQLLAGPPKPGTNVILPKTPPSVAPTFHIADSLPPLNTIIGTIAIEPFARTTVAENGTMWTGARVASETPMTSATVDRTVVPLPGNAPPRYPSILANAGVEGEVTMQYVVDTLGRVEPNSVRAMRGDRPAFERAVRDALERMAFVPAEAGGRKVRQLVEQTFTFAISRR